METYSTSFSVGGIIIRFMEGSVLLIVGGPDLVFMEVLMVFSASSVGVPWIDSSVDVS